MDTLNLHIEQFKCFTQADIELNNLTILTGANAAGKSTVIQSLLLLHQAKWSGRLSSENGLNMVSVSLQNEAMAFDYGNADDVTNRNAKSDVILSLGNAKLSYPLLREHDEGWLTFDFQDGALDALPFGADSMRYLTAERLGPRYEVPRSTSAKDGCGCHGQHTATVFDATVLNPAHDRRWLHKEDGNFSIQRDQWIDYIFPNMRINVMPLTEKKCQVTILNGYINKRSVATNVGFGISYALPVILDALLVEEGGWLIVENPEAHLHAKAQSNMGYFLGCMAAAGVRVVVETHSEHIVNGIRRAALTPESLLKAEHVNIYYFNQENPQQRYQLINIDGSGNLTDFPIDFFDQQRQDLLQLMKLAHSHNAK